MTKAEPSSFPNQSAGICLQFPSQGTSMRDVDSEIVIFFTLPQHVVPM